MKPLKIFTAILLALAAFTQAAVAASSSGDTRFVNYAMRKSLMEIEVGHLGHTNTSNTAIQAVGERLVADHATSFQQAATLAQGLGMNVPQTLTRESRRGIISLWRVNESRFDRTYLDYVIRDHMASIRQFENAAARARSAEVRAFARTQLPVLSQHMVMALEARETVLQSSQ